MHVAKAHFPYPLDSIDAALRSGREHTKLQEVAEFRERNFPVAIRVENPHELQRQGKQVRTRKMQPRESDRVKYNLKFIPET